MDKQGAVALLRKALNLPDATFREGQWKAIEKLTVGKEKLLVIQRTGWGKSSVYFISTRILRYQGKGRFIIISPLLTFMRKQLEVAELLGINVVSINSTNFENRKVIQNEVLKNQVDSLLISQPII